MGGGLKPWGDLRLGGLRARGTETGGESLGDGIPKRTAIVPAVSRVDTGAVRR